MVARSGGRASDPTIGSVVFPAFGAGFGQVAPDEVARQMAVAWKLFLEPPYPPTGTAWSLVSG
jgi:O-acetyl-ADP-ribose deacetylase (regulator of RNase III)